MPALDLLLAAPARAASLAALATPVAHTHTGGGLPAVALVAAALGGLLLLACLALVLARAYAWEPRWSLYVRHSFAEAGSRASETWSEFGDWLRLGR